MPVIIKNLQRRVKVHRKQLQSDTILLLKLLHLEHVEVSILIVNDAIMQNLNMKHRRANKTTDVLSFPMYDSIHDIPSSNEILLGDIVINIHMAYRQSEETGYLLQETIRRLLIHGLLHLIGFDHDRNAYQRNKMSRKEIQLFNALAKMD